MGIFPLTSARWPRTPFAVLAAVALATAACAPQSGQAPSPAPVVGLKPSPVDAPQPSGGVRVSIDQNSSEARYRAREVLSAFGFTTEAIGSTQQISGTIVLDSTGRVLPEESMVVVDLRGLSSDERLRDRFIRDFTLQLTPMCDDDPQATPPMTDGPFFTPSSPERRSLLDPNIAGTRMVLTGYVLSRQCQPITGALADFWQADDSGAYDNVGYRLRGHQFTDEGGRYQLETVVPGLYPGRTRHFHVKVQAPNGPLLTTQLFFPDEARNRTDRIFDPALLLAIEDADDGKWGAFNFVVSVAPA